MKFYGRESELNLLEETRRLSEQSAKMTVIVGRRRIGKTSLAIKAFEGKKSLYFFISRKNEALLCREFIEEIELAFGKPVLGEFRNFSRLFEYLLVMAQVEPFTLIIDEFQEFYQVNPSVYSEMQNLWDKYKSISKINLVICGSVYSLMKKIFENGKEPLFGRANEKIHLKPFNVETLKKIYTNQQTPFNPDDLLAFYTITGGVAKYVEIFTDKNRFSLAQMLTEILRENSLLLEEGKNIIIEEFGKDYITYFSILSLIASSKTSRTEIESILGKNIGGYLERLENDYQIIKSLRPIFSKPGGRVQKYFIEDNFLCFWFRFIYKYRSAIELGNYTFVRSMVERDFDQFSGQFLEKYFREKLMITGQYSQIGRYWNKRNENEIDIVALDDWGKQALIAEVKLNAHKINPDQLKSKAAEIAPMLYAYELSFRGFSLEDM
jgi:AAA+ ATPase superfamily predicted ATPase